MPEQNLTQKSKINTVGEKTPNVEAPPVPPAEQHVEQNFPLPETTSKPEAAPQPEIAPETSKEQEAKPEVKTHEDEEKVLDSKIDALKTRLKKKPKPAQIPQVKDELVIQIEKIMEEGLKDVFFEMTPVQREEFKMKGEKTAFEIRELMKGAKIKIKKIFMLLVTWLKIIPGVNRFFLEQEAKIKADKIMALQYMKHGK